MTDVSGMTARNPLAEANMRPGDVNLPQVSPSSLTLGATPLNEDPGRLLKKLDKGDSGRQCSDAAYLVETGKSKDIYNPHNR